ncbi:hypothetical protein ACLOJK_013019 [Asimina triloba]
MPVGIAIPKAVKGPIATSVKGHECSANRLCAELRDGVEGLWDDKVREAIYWGLSCRAKVVRPDVRWGTSSLVSVQGDGGALIRHTGPEVGPT